MAKRKDIDAQVRREARQQGFERRPSTASQSDEAERLERGFALLNDGDTDQEEDSATPRITW
jgi:hypothetical protein